MVDRRRVIEFDASNFDQQLSQLANDVRLTPIAGPVRYVAGIDVAYTDTKAFAAAVVLDQAQDIVEVSTVISEDLQPYVPGQFALREGLLAIEALAGLTTIPDLIMIDGHGIAHPKRCGLASIVGLVFELPTIGVAKKHLHGTYTAPEGERYATSPVISDGETIGYAVCTSPGVNPMFVSPGHLCDFEGALEAVRQWESGYRIPEPLRAAHHASITSRATEA